MVNNPIETISNNSFLTANYMPRPRIDEIFEAAASCKLVYVIAGAGYGKTQAVHHYIKQQKDAIVRWVQLAESDNIGSRYWESLTHYIALDNPVLAARLRELGFPETLARFKQFAEILKTYEHSSRKTFLVLDDFHLIHSKQALVFAERCAHLQIPGACVIIISRKEPEINAVSLFSKGRASIITEDELRFTDGELAQFLRWRDIPFSAAELPQYIDATKGWALAVKLLSLVIEKFPKNIALALATMKQNIFKLMETEVWNDFPEEVQKAMVRLSLVSDLPLRPLRKVFDGDSLSRYVPQLSSFIWFDSFTSEYRIHPLYLEFIQNKQTVLSDEEKQDTYRRAAQWCCEHDFYLDAMNYYAKARQYDRMLELFLSFPFRLPNDACEYFLRILEELDPENKERDNQSVLLLKNLFIPLLLTGAGRYEEAGQRSFDSIRQWENSDDPFALNLLGVAYSNLAYIDMYTCIVTHQYDAHEHLKKSVEYFKLSSAPQIKSAGAFAVADVRSYACLVGEGASLAEFDKFLEAAGETSLYIAETLHNMYYGYDDLVSCELAFFKNQPDLAKKHAHNAILKARENGQHNIEAMAEQYMLRIAIQQGDSLLVKEILKQLRAHLDNPDFWNRRLIYDLYVGSFYVQIGIPGMAPDWYIMDDKEVASEVRIPTRELIVSVRYCIATKKYSQALTILCKSYPREPQEQFLFGELMLSLLIAVARQGAGDTAGAMADFERAYELSFRGEFEMFFIELGKNLRPLCTTALKKENCKIPAEWLKSIGRKASIYAKKADVVKDSVKRDENIEDTV
ncbi:MAG: hypothetical protein FWE86_01175, partial [Oscillospiraceae bacterium]|nr:hypothetical protein [Oscillospiraceae bacterium]